MKLVKFCFSNIFVTGDFTYWMVNLDITLITHDIISNNRVLETFGLSYWIKRFCLVTAESFCYLHQSLLSSLKKKMKREISVPETVLVLKIIHISHSCNPQPLCSQSTVFVYLLHFGFLICSIRLRAY